MEKKNKRIVIFDLWETLIFGTRNSAISIFYKEITGEAISEEQHKKCTLISESKPRQFLEKFLNIVTPSNYSSMLLSLKNERSPLYKSIIKKFNNAVNNDFKEIRWVPGAVELLESLKKKYTLVVVSNLCAYQKRYLYDDMKIMKYFDKYLFSCDLGMNKNDILKNAVNILNTEPNNVVYVGRSYEYNIIPAVNANLSAIRLINDKNLIFTRQVERLIDDEFSDICQQLSADKIISGKKRPQALFVIPPFYKLLGSHNNRMNLAASHLSAYLSSKGYANRIYHCDSKPSENYITRYQIVFNSIDFYRSLESDTSFDEFERYYKKHPYEIAFVTCGDVLNPSFDSGNWDSAQKIAKIIRKINPKAFIVAMGPETGHDSEDFDLIVRGEVEALADDIMNRKIRGVVQGSLLAEEELKSYPIFDIKNIVTNISPVSLDTVMWRRGCEGTCDFCRVAQINNGKVRSKSIDSVLKEMKVKYESLKLRNFYIVDANFTSDKRSVIEFCRRLKKELPGVSWRTESRFDTLDSEVLYEMKNAGCTHLKLGLENALHEKHQVRTKKVNIVTASDWIKIIQKTGIKCIIYLMLGGRWFTPDQYREMFRNAEGLNADGYTVSLYNPYPDTAGGISQTEWDKRRFIGSHLDIRLIDFWKIPINIVDSFFTLELKKGREDKDVRKFIC